MAGGLELDALYLNYSMSPKHGHFIATKIDRQIDVDIDRFIYIWQIYDFWYELEWTCTYFFFPFCIKTPYYSEFTACKNWITSTHTRNFTESAFIPVSNFLCLIWTSKIIIFCAQVVGVWKAYVSSETDTVLIWLCSEFQVWIPCSNTKPLLQRPVAKPILLAY